MVSLSRTGQHTLQGTVAGVRFFGAYYEVEVWAGEISLMVRTEGLTVQKGDTVHLSVMPERVWYL